MTSLPVILLSKISPHSSFHCRCQSKFHSHTSSASSKTSAALQQNATYNKNRTSLVVFLQNQAEAKKLEDSSVYLSLPATKLEMEEKGYSTTGKSAQNLGNCSISKDSFQISTLVCSTKLTQNGTSSFASRGLLFFSLHER